MATGDLIVSNAQLGVGTTEQLSTLTVHARAPFVLTGTITAPETTVTGTGTAFLTELVPGDEIFVDLGLCDTTRTVVTIDSDTELTIDRPFYAEVTDEPAVGYPSAVRVDNTDGAQVHINQHGSVGVGTIAPQAQLDVTGFGAGEFGGCPVNLRLQTVEAGSAWNLVMSTTNCDGTTPGIAMWVDDYSGDGNATLSHSFYDGASTMVDTMRFDVNAMLLQVGFKVSPLAVNSDYTIQPTDYHVFVNAGSGGVTITLPSSNASYGQLVTIYKRSGTGDVTITPEDGTQINGGTASKTLTTPFSAMQLIADFDTWVASVVPAA